MTEQKQSGITPYHIDTNPVSDLIELRPNRPETNMASDQNGPPSFDVQKYAPPGVTVNLTEKAGSLFLPHVLNQFAVQAIARKADLIIFQCLVRFSLGFNRPICKASNQFIARWTGLHTPHIRRGLRSLKAMGLIRLLTPGEPTGKPTIYEIPIVAGLLNWKHEKESGTKMDGDHIGLGPMRSDPGSKVGPNRIHQWDQPESTGRTNLVPKKEKEIKKSKKTLSQLDALPSNLRVYILELRPHQKRVEEEYHLFQLLMDYPPGDIDDALAFITKHGALDTGETVHSPMKYLSFAAEQVIAESKRRREKLLRTEQLKIQIERQQEEDRIKRKAEEKEFKIALERFETSLSEDEQNVVLNDFAQAHFSSSPFMPKNVIRRMAISDWHKNIKSGTKG